MRVVFVAWHGSEHTRRWISYFAEKGHDVHVVTCGNGPATREEEGGYTIHDLGVSRAGKVGYLAKIPAARRIIRDLDPDVLHAHYATSYGMLALASGVRPLVVTAHGSDVLIAPRNWLLRKLVVRVLRGSTLITVPSEHMRAAVDDLIAPVDRRIVVVQYGVDVDSLVSLGDRVRAAASTLDGRPRIVSVRHLWPIYRIDLLIRGLARLRDNGLDFSCDIAGDGPEREQLQRLVTKLALDDRVAFHGHLSTTQVEGLIAQADVYVSVAESDGVSISLLEALALGAVPVLADIPGNHGWIRDGTSGILVEPTPESIADGVRRAVGLERGTAVAINRSAVRRLADRATNLGLLESLLLELRRTVGASGPA